MLISKVTRQVWNLFQDCTRKRFWNWAFEIDFFTKIERMWRQRKESLGKKEGRKKERNKERNKETKKKRKKQRNKETNKQKIKKQTNKK